MKKVIFYQVDAFTDHLFGGNPAAVCLLDTWPDDALMQSIAMENNLSETAFVIRKGELFEIRWFTPAVEVDLCGHATLASAFVIFNHSDFQGGEIIVHSPRSGELKVRKDGTKLFLDFPTDKITRCDNLAEIGKGIGTIPIELYRGKTDYMAILGSEEEVSGVQPDFEAIGKLDARGLIITAPGKSVDFVSRFFGPQSGVNEDPVTGSAHTSLIPYWSERLGKTVMSAKQISKRGGTLDCRNDGERVRIGGEAKLYATGEIYLPNR